MHDQERVSFNWYELKVLEDQLDKPKNAASLLNWGVSWFFVPVLKGEPALGSATRLTQSIDVKTEELGKRKAYLEGKRRSLRERVRLRWLWDSIRFQCIRKLERRS